MVVLPMKEGAVVAVVALIEAGVVEVEEELLLTRTALVRKRLPSSRSLQKSLLHGMLHQRTMMGRTQRRLPSQLGLGVVLLRMPHPRLQLQPRR